ncbi:MAG: discoidin domain-containing protein [Clostridia bacterium]|nr:discoidin domain-containing protein [Clostridia bacterium]MBO5914764.1 discoidin domain-containing protein [Clostridia bacterium]
MKKLSLILALVLVLTCGVLAACGDKTEESSAAESVAESAAESKAESSAAATESSEAATEESSEAATESSEAATEESSEAEESTPSEEIPEGTAPSELKGKNVALNKSYTGGDPAITTGDGTACGYTANLTDGQASMVSAYDGTWFALWCNKNSSLPSNNAPDGVGTIIVDLGKSTKDINAIRVNLYQANTSGIGAPESIVAYVSEDNTNWTAVGTLVLPETTDPAWAEIAVDNATAQYVKLVITLTDTWCFLNEIEVYA